MFVSLETPRPLETSHAHIVTDIFSYSTHKVIFYYFLRSAIGDASARNKSCAGICFFIKYIYELQNFQCFSKQFFA
jgi:hypothetical protein